jgi:hypothetical protein
MVFRSAVLGAALALASFAAAAQSYRCVGTDGKKYYGSSVPPQCVGVMVEQISPSGAVMKRIPAQAGAVERAWTAAEEAEHRKQAAIAKEQARRDQALLATYASEKDVEDTRRRALENDQRLLRELEGKIAELQKRKASGQDVSAELSAQEGLVTIKKKEIAAINAKYDEDKKRFLQLTGQAK